MSFEAENCLEPHSVLSRAETRRRRDFLSLSVSASLRENILSLYLLALNDNLPFDLEMELAQA